MKHTLSILVEDNTGVLSRISGLFTRRGYNIQSLTVGNTETPGLSRMTIVVDEDEKTIEQISKQLYKLVEVVKLIDLTEESFVDRELVLMKVKVTPATKSEMIQMTQIFRANIIDVAEDTFVIEATGTSSKIDALEDAMRLYGIKESVRTGRVALSRGTLRKED